MSDDLTLICPRCGNKSSDEDGFYIISNHDAYVLRHSPFDLTLRKGVEVKCGVCNLEWLSVKAVVGYQKAFMFRQDFPELFKTFAVVHCLQQQHGVQVKGSNPLAETYSLADLYIDPTKGF